MKTKRRHELQTNTLADWVGHKIETIMPYTGYLAALVLATCLISIFFVYQSRSSRAESESHWTALQQAMGSGDIQQLVQFVEDDPNSRASLFGRLSLADVYLAQGASHAGLDRAKAQENFQSALTHYEIVAVEARDPLLKNRALLGAGKTAEWLLQLEQAKTYYDRVEGPLAIEARQRLADLDQPGTRRFYENYEAAGIVPTPPEKQEDGRLEFGLPGTSPTSQIDRPSDILLESLDDALEDSHSPVKKSVDGESKDEESRNGESP